MDGDVVRLGIAAIIGATISISMVAMAVAQMVTSRRRARELGMDGAAWEPIIADAQELIDNAQALLNVQG